MTNNKGTIAIACCDGKESKTCTICFIYNAPSPYLSDVYYKVS